MVCHIHGSCGVHESYRSLKFSPPLDLFSVSFFRSFFLMVFSSSPPSSSFSSYFFFFSSSSSSPFSSSFVASRPENCNSNWGGVVNPRVIFFPCVMQESRDIACSQVPTWKLLLFLEYFLFIFFKWSLALVSIFALIMSSICLSFIVCSHT